MKILSYEVVFYTTLMSVSMWSMTAFGKFLGLGL